MARLNSEGNVKIWKVPTIVDIDEPSEEEIGAGIDLTPFVPTTGVDITWTQNTSTLAMLDESFVISAIGTESAEITLTGVRDDGATDPFWDAFERGENFYLVIGRFGSADQDGDRVEVYPVQSHRPVPLAPAENEFQQVEVTLGVTDVPELNAVVGGGS